MSFSTLLIASADAFGASVYAVTTNQAFGVFDLNTGAFGQIGSDLPEEGNALAPLPNGNFLNLAFSGNLYSIDRASGLATLLGATGLGDCTGPDSPCPSNTSNQLVGFNGGYYATDIANNLYIVNPVTAAATLIAPSGMPGVPPAPYKLDATNPDGTVNIADESLFVAGGKLYGTFDAGTIDFATGTITPLVAPALYQINIGTGTATRIGDTAFGIFSSLDVGGIIYSYSAPDSGILTLDLATGSTTPFTLVDPSVGFISGDAVATPEPYTLVLAGFCVFMALVYRFVGTPTSKGVC